MNTNTNKYEYDLTWVIFRLLLHDEDQEWIYILDDSGDDYEKVAQELERRLEQIIIYFKNSEEREEAEFYSESLDAVKEINE